MATLPEVLFEDADILVVDKPAGMFVHPSPGHEKGTLTEALLRHCPSLAGVGSRARPGIVHRLDAETSGVMVLAKSQRAYLNLRAMFAAHTDVRKTYLAVLHGAPSAKTGTVDAPIGRKPWDPHRMAIVADGKRAVTHWTVLGKRGGLALVEFVIETGRTHQIRVHAARLGHPIVGDALYGDCAKDARLRPRPMRQLLHAVTLAFPHPVTGRPQTFSAAPPADIVYAI
ncbi:MAG: RluA family pseudouridine synthase [Kiritimatiellia bacterium]